MLKAIIDWSIGNRFLVCVLGVVIAVGGAWSLSTTPLDAIPDLSDVQVIVQTDWPGQDPQTIEDQLTYPISSALLNTLARARRPRVLVLRDLVRLRDLRRGNGSVLGRAVGCSSTSPRRTRPPHRRAARARPGCELAGWVYLYTLEDTRGTRHLGELRDLQDYYVRYQLASVPGVAEVASLGGAVQQYQVTVDRWHSRLRRAAGPGRRGGSALERRRLAPRRVSGGDGDTGPAIAISRRLSKLRGSEA